MSKEKVTIGICDDESFFVEQIKFCCESYLEEIFDDYEFVIINSGEDVINYHGEVLDILFLDIQMDNIDGISLAKEILETTVKVAGAIVTIGGAVINALGNSKK